jgi:hypothetical protein
MLSHFVGSAFLRCPRYVAAAIALRRCAASAKDAPNQESIFDLILMNRVDLCESTGQRSFITAIASHYGVLEQQE